MNKSVLFVFLLAVGYSAAAYSHKYDHIDVMSVLRNARMLHRYVQCLLDVPNTCTKDGDYLKQVLPEAIKTNCAQCDAKQEDTAVRVTAYLMKHHDDWWKQIDERYNAGSSEFVAAHKAKIDEYKNTL
ncbi:ejaculatory bulb-specific protein 3-like [Diorhabda carinulata]|uniref:ejaculatory bulb-specific protein 3-like n=1 Tax=Diorhabda sublineata TaxID=1163346 RepID=UPI0024E09EB2|nr:ejaculatory bulb-specific protein 3-like [Diorhabda sublineata]XP_057656970.1 ejaculatory bulb-specific protein 3-like [Diorhabda carinulata]